MTHQVEHIDVTDEEIAALDDEIDMWREWFDYRSQTAGAALAIAAAIELGEHLKEEPPKVQ